MNEGLRIIEQYQYNQYIKKRHRANVCRGILMVIGVVAITVLVALMLTPFVV